MSVVRTCPQSGQGGILQNFAKKVTPCGKIPARKGGGARAPQRAGLAKILHPKRIQTARALHPAAILQ